MVVRLLNVSKRVRVAGRFKDILCGVSLEVRRGEALLVRGPSGSGKTTLLALAAAMLTPSSGEVYLLGEPVSRFRERHRAAVRRTTVGCVFQDLLLLENWTVFDNVLLSCVPQGISDQDRERARSLLEERGLWPRAHDRVRGLSGGERQRVALCRALLTNPALLVLDEPTAHLDEQAARMLLDFVGRLAENGTTLLVSTHDPRLAHHATFHRSVELVEGRMRDEAS